MEEMGFKKIDFKETNSNVSNDDFSKDTNIGSGNKKIASMISSKHKKKKKILLIALALFVVVSIFMGLKMKTIYADAQRTSRQAKSALDALKKQNIVLAKEELQKTDKEVAKLKKDIEGLAFLGWIPFAGAYYNDVVHLLNASSNGVNAGIIAADSIIPYADVLGLKGEKSFIAGSAEDRIRLAVKTMGKVVPRIDDLESELEKAKKEIDQVESNRYPNFWVFKKTRNQIEQIKVLTDEGVSAVDQGKPLIKVLPELLGDSKEKKYLILFQNDKELRPTGGFLTFYSVFRVENGIFHVDTSSDIYDLEKTISSRPAAPYMIKKYLPNESVLNIRNANYSPDFVESMETFKKLYDTSGDKRKIDGIIALDTQFLVHIIDILGEVQAGGITFTSKNDPRCDCPQVVYVLEDTSTRPVNYVKENRKALLGELLYAIMNKSLSSSPKLYWGKLMQAAMKDMNEKHILLSLYDKEAQKGAEALNWAGRIREFSGDYIHINDANFGGQKSNMYVKQSVRMDYDTNSNGEIKKTVKITYKNPYPYSDCNLERGGLCLNATLRNFQRVYVPKGSTLSDVKGSEVKVETKEDYGKTFYESFLRVNPLGKAEITYTYKLPFKLDKSSLLPLLIQKQPGMDKISYEIYVNGKKSENFDLVSDKQLNLKLN